MAWLPTLKLLLVQVAAGALPPPDSATAAQPASALPPSLKLMVPVGATPLTVAVKTTLVPALAGLAELPSPVVVGDCDCEEHDGNLNAPMRVCQLPLVPLVWLL